MTRPSFVGDPTGGSGFGEWDVRDAPKGDEIALQLLGPMRRGVLRQHARPRPLRQRCPIRLRRTSSTSFGRLAGRSDLPWTCSISASRMRTRSRQPTIDVAADEPGAAGDQNVQAASDRKYSSAETTIIYKDEALTFDVEGSRNSTMTPHADNWAGVRTRH